MIGNVSQTIIRVPDFFNTSANRYKTIEYDSFLPPKNNYTRKIFREVDLFNSNDVANINLGRRYLLTKQGISYHSPESIKYDINTVKDYNMPKKKSEDDDVNKKMNTYNARFPKVVNKKLPKIIITKTKDLMTSTKVEKSEIYKKILFEQRYMTEDCLVSKNTSNLFTIPRVKKFNDRYINNEIKYQNSMKSKVKSLSLVKSNIKEEAKNRTSHIMGKELYYIKCNKKPTFKEELMYYLGVPYVNKSYTNTIQ